VTAMTWADRLRALYRGNNFLFPAQYGPLADYIDEQTATIERLSTQLGHAADKLMEQGWNDVAARMDRWAENGYAGDWVDPQYEAVS
jgi:hypothetical protein